MPDVLDLRAAFDHITTAVEADGFEDAADALEDAATAFCDDWANDCDQPLPAWAEPLGAALKAAIRTTGDVQAGRRALVLRTAPGVSFTFCWDPSIPTTGKARRMILDMVIRALDDAAVAGGDDGAA